ncbi:hypothetical protein FRC01_004298 [Tulasnella sp. 417]|nr:hypothetical protein FRC01_004298 [Tulasnella sp. 417]
MASFTAYRGVDAPAVTVGSTSRPLLNSLLPHPHIRFISSPMQHGLGRSSLDAANDDKVLQAIVSSMTARFGHLSLVELPLLVSPTPTVLAPVNTTTPAGTVPSPSAPLPSALRELLRTRRKLLHKLSATGFKLRARLSKGVPKARKQTEAPIPSRTDSPFSLVRYEDLFTTQPVDSEGGLLRSDALEAGLPSVVTFAVQPTPVQPPVNPTVLQPAPSDAPSPTTSWTVRTTVDEVVDETMEEDEHPPPSPVPASPIPMDVEARSLPRDATSAPESIQDWFEASPSWNAPSPTPEPVDAAMSDEEQIPTNSESSHLIEPTDTVMMDPSSPQIARSTVPSRDVDMGDAEDGNNPFSSGRETISVVPSMISTMDSPAADQPRQPHTPWTTSGWDSMPVTASPASSTLPPLPTQSSAGEASQVDPSPTPTANTSFNSTTATLNSPASPLTPTPASRLASTQRQAPLVQSAPTSNANANSNSTVAEQVTVPWTSATRSTAGPSTRTSTSPATNSTATQEQVRNAHASRVHQVLGKLGLSNPASKSTTPARTEESEEAEAAALIAHLNSTARRNPPESHKKPLLLRPPSEPKATKGSASRSLMDDIMAGFGRSTNSRSSPSVVGAGRQVAAWPSGRAPSTTLTTPNVLGLSPAIPSTPNTSLPVVAGRQPGPQPTQPSPAGTSRQVAACPFGRAPSTVSGAGNVNGLSEDAMDGVESGARVVKGSRRVERLAKMGVNWQGVQQQAQQTQSALDMARSNAAALASRELNAEELRSASERWHAAQPPPPPEALPYITTKTKRRAKKTQ